MKPKIHINDSLWFAPVVTGTGGEAGPGGSGAGRTRVMPNLLMSCAMLVVLLVSFLFAAAQKSQRKSLFEVQLNAGNVLNTDKVESFGYGGMVELLVPFGNRNYITASARVMTNPFYGGAHFWPLKKGFDHEEDALNYTMESVGLRINISSEERGFVYAEPRVGLVFANGFRWAGFGVSPTAGFQMKRWDLAVFMDGAFGNKELNTGRTHLWLGGIGVGYIF